ncbi:hypothetical protein ACOJUR_03495 [Alicyclobacillus tolerans]|uniref:Uncharacterized protein n=2 Tax=Alicyclobacillus tolerans TaxID=90970 RepID=A0A1M6M348_9BACL|nr:MULTISPECIES: hypothetical protein [Alicyclobacillus]MDP9728636.1 membrane protein YdbS with pleckstrin-like domain [Alicyclobacillus tengchongensis]SHJ77891.1 hypothetical protein SAMN05443507_103161 [Alicyclobacillus montanus]
MPILMFILQVIVFFLIWRIVLMVLTNIIRKNTLSIWVRMIANLVFVIFYFAVLHWTHGYWWWSIASGLFVGLLFAFASNNGSSPE